MPAHKRRAVITGLGPITAVGIGREALWEGLRAERSGIRHVTCFDSSIFNAHCAAEIPDWKPEEFFPPHRLKRLDRYAQFSVASAKRLDHAAVPGAWLGGCGGMAGWMSMTESPHV